MQQDLKQLINSLVDLNNKINLFEDQRDEIRNLIKNEMLISGVDKLTIPDVCSVFLQSKDTFKNYPERVQKLKEELDREMRFAELNNLAEKNTTHFIKLTINKNGNQ